MIASEQIGAAISNLEPVTVPKNPGAETPTTWNGWPSKGIVLPMTVEAPAKVLLPKTVTEDRDSWAAAGVVVHSEEPPQGGLHAKRGEIFPAGKYSLNVLSVDALPEMDRHFSQAKRPEKTS